MRKVIIALCLGTFLHAHQTIAKITTVIIAFSTLFEPNEAIMEQHIRSELGVTGSIRLLFSGIPTKEEIKQSYFETLNAMHLDGLQCDATCKTTLQSGYAPWEKEYQFPPILRYLFISSTADQEQKLYRSVTEQLEAMETVPISRKRILQGIIDFVCQSKKMNPIMQPVKPMINLVKWLKKKGYNLILIGNVPGHAWKTFMHDCPQARIISDLFNKENIFISGLEGVYAQSPQMYTKIFKKNDYTPEECLVIDNNTNNLRYPIQKKMKTIVCNTKKSSMKSFNAQLKKLLAAD